MQMVWVYDDAVDWDELRRFHQDFGFGLAGRMIEPSVLPFGRHRWVSSTRSRSTSRHRRGAPSTF